MYALMPLVSRITSGELQFIAARMKYRAAFAVLMGLLVLVAAGFGLAAATIALAAEVGALEACLILAAVSLALMVVVYIAGRIVDMRLRRRALMRRQAQTPMRVATGIVMAKGVLQSSKLLTLAVPVAMGLGALAYLRMRSGNGGEDEADGS